MPEPQRRPHKRHCIEHCNAAVAHPVEQMHKTAMKQVRFGVLDIVRRNMAKAEDQLEQIEDRRNRPLRRARHARPGHFDKHRTLLRVVCRLQ